MAFINIARKTGRGLAASAALVAALSLTVPNPAEARDGRGGGRGGGGGIGTGAAVGIGLGAFALGSALGARSILANPADARVNHTLNERLQRSEFMPFAPVVAEEDAGEVFDLGGVNRYAARFMTICCAVRPQWRTRIAAVVHIDGSARPQIIGRAANPLYFDILAAFKARTGLPVLVNTSFNVHEEPIVNRPEECLKALVDGRVDFVTTTDAVWMRNR